METKTELKTIHDLPEKMKSMYGIFYEREAITSPFFIGLTDNDYVIEDNGVTHTIRIIDKCVITLWNEVNHIHITIL